MSSSSQFPDPATRELAPTPDAAALPVAQLLEWKPWIRPDSRLVGHATVGFASGLTIARIPVFRGTDGGVSVGVPSVPELDGEGRARTGSDGKRLYSPIVGFSSAAAKLRWQRVVLATLTASGLIP